MRGIFTTIHTIALNTRDALARHFDFFHDGPKPVALFLRVPFTGISAFIERATVPVGFGHERGEGRLEFCAGRIQGVVCVEPVTGR